MSEVHLEVPVTIFYPHFNFDLIGNLRAAIFDYCVTVALIGVMDVGHFLI